MGRFTSCLGLLPRAWGRTKGGKELNTEAASMKGVEGVGGVRVTGYECGRGRVSGEGCTSW